jgi:hypothetical protein
MSTTNEIRALDLSQRPPRSMRVRLGGYAILPRVLDKCRAVLVGKNGEYKFNCPLDQHLFNFVGIDAEAFKAEVAKGAGDSGMLAWVQANAKVQRSPWEIQQWSAYHVNRGPDSDAETLAYFANAVAKLSTTREDIRAWADMLDLDDHVSYGGQP